MVRKKHTLETLCRHQWALETLPHVFVVLIGFGGAAVFGAANARQHVFESVLALLISLLSAYALCLQKRRARLTATLDVGVGKARQPSLSSQSSCERQSSPVLQSPSRSPMPTHHAARAREYLQEHATDVVTVLQGACPTEACNAFLMSLAHENSRTLNCLREYEEGCKPMRHDQDDSGVLTARASVGEEIPMTEAAVTVPSPAPSPLLDLGTLDRGVSTELAVTPRSPCALPSPEEQRRNRCTGVGGSGFATFAAWPGESDATDSPRGHSKASVADSLLHTYAESQELTAEAVGWARQVSEIERQRRLSKGSASSAGTIGTFSSRRGGS